MIIKKIGVSQYSEAQDFYSSVDYKTPISPSASVFAAYIDQDIVGLVRLEQELGYLVLRGMMIAKAQQRKGLGSRMLNKLEKEIGSVDCFCLPHDWLIAFYGQIGFQPARSSELPEFLTQRLAEYQTKFPNMIAMKRNCKRPKD